MSRGRSSRSTLHPACEREHMLTDSVITSKAYTLLSTP